jgi:hypothetical protein
MNFQPELAVTTLGCQLRLNILPTLVEVQPLVVDTSVVGVQPLVVDGQ